MLQVGGPIGPWACDDGDPVSLGVSSGTDEGAETRRNQVIKQIRTLEDSLNQLQTTLLKCEMEVAALQYNYHPPAERLSQVRRS